MNRSLTLIFFLTVLLAWSQEDEPTMSFEAYNPPSTLVVPGAEIKRAKFPFVDIHSHQWNLTKGRIASLVGEMEELNILGEIL